MGFILLMALVGPLGWYLWAGHSGDEVGDSMRERLLTGRDELFGVDFRGRVGWLVGKYGFILHSKDGGRTWEKQLSGTVRALSGVSFADDRHGFVAGAGGTVLATADGGRSWEFQRSGVREHLLGVQALSPDKVYAVGAFGTVVSTADGGRRWRKHKLLWRELIPRLIEESGYMEPNLNGLYFLTPEVGWVVGVFGLILHPRDGGGSWVAQRYGSDLPQLLAVRFRGRRRGWAIGQQGTLIRTTDGGERWEKVGIGLERDLYGISLDGERGVIVGQGVVLESSGWGSKWALVESMPGNLWFSGVAINSREAVVVGEAGTVRFIQLEGRKTASSDVGGATQ